MKLHLPHQRKKWPLFLMASVIVLVLGVAAFFYFQKPKITLPTIVVIQGSIVEQAEAVGYIKTRNFSTVKSQVDGIVEAIYHEEGEYVKKDTVLLKVKPTPAPTEYAEAYKKLANEIAEEKDAETDLKRYQYLLKTKVITSNDNDKDYIDAQKKYHQERNERILAEQKLALITSGETVVGGQVVASVVKSPIDGYILYQNIDVGDPVISISSSQSATPLFVVANMQELMFQGVVDEKDAAKIKTGISAKIKVGSLPGKEITGVINKIALQSDKEIANLGIDDYSSSQGGSGSSSSSSSSPFNVGFRIEITNLQLPKDIVLRSGYSATASIEIQKLDNILILPMRVIQFKDGKSYVLLPDGKSTKPKEQFVEIGISDSMNVEIKSGLKLGDQVIDQPDPTVVTHDK